MGKEQQTGEKRREQLLALMRQSNSPLSGAILGEKTGVSRQVVVQDIALLRTKGIRIVSTARGYVLAEEKKQPERTFKVCHTEEQVADELQTMVDYGGEVVDVMVNHRTYGKVTAPLHVKSRRDVQNFLNELKSSKSSLLLNITSGYHFHTVRAESEEILDEIEQALKDKGYLVERLAYEMAQEP